MNEIWKDIEGYEGYYQISNMGNVRSVNRSVVQRHYSGGKANHTHEGRPMTIQNYSGRAFVGLNKDGKQKRFQVGRMVAIHFIENPNGYKLVNHLDADPMNNRVDNLEWCDQSRNIKWAYDNGTKVPPHMKKVNQLDMNGQCVRTWDSISLATRTLGINNIYKVCIGERKQAGGFRWEYA